jgi:predicted Holliday junction resolvase-like endonuclease
LNCNTSLLFYGGGMGFDSSTSAESSGVGQIVEMLSPSLPGFFLLPSDCRALFKPIDYVGFMGLSISGEIEPLVFIELKSGWPRLSKQQRQIKSEQKQMKRSRPREKRA